MIQDVPPPPATVVSVKEVDASLWPAMRIKGEGRRVVSLDVTGAPNDIAGLKERVEEEGWTIDVVATGGARMQVSATGKTLEQVAMLNFRITNGDFGPLTVRTFHVRDRENGK